MTDGDVGHGGGIGEMHRTWRQRRNETWVHEPLAPRYPRTISRVKGELESGVACIDLDVLETSTFHDTPTGIISNHQSRMSESS